MRKNFSQQLVLVHGLWFRSAFLRPLARRLRLAGFTVHVFDYRTTGRDFDDSARALAEFCTREAAGGAHLVGHSLGGLLILRMLELASWTPPGRVLLLGTPLHGSTVARRLASWPGTARLLGHAATPLDAGFRAWPQGREVGMIAGTRGLGLGQVTGRLPTPHDGTVAVAETRHPGLAAHLELPATHTGMLYSQAVAQAGVRFLRHGRFG